MSTKILEHKVYNFDTIKATTFKHYYELVFPDNEIGIASGWKISEIICVFTTQAKESGYNIDVDYIKDNMIRITKDEFESRITNNTLRIYDECAGI